MASLPILEHHVPEPHVGPPRVVGSGFCDCRCSEGGPTHTRQGPCAACCLLLGCPAWPGAACAACYLVLGLAQLLLATWVLCWAWRCSLLLGRPARVLLATGATVLLACPGPFTTGCYSPGPCYCCLGALLGLSPQMLPYWAFAALALLGRPLAFCCWVLLATWVRGPDHLSALLGLAPLVLLATCWCCLLLWLPFWALAAVLGLICLSCWAWRRCATLGALLRPAPLMLLALLGLVLRCCLLLFVLLGLVLLATWVQCWGILLLGAACNLGAMLGLSPLAPACYFGALLDLLPLMLLATCVPRWAWCYRCCLLLGCSAGHFAAGSGCNLGALPFAAGCCLLLGCERR